jgi:putative DNA methylase
LRQLPEHEAIAESPSPVWSPEMDLPNNPRDFKTPNYGLTNLWRPVHPPPAGGADHVFRPGARAIARIRADALAAGMPDDGRGLDAGGDGATAYAEAVGVYLSAFSIVSKLIQINSSCN